MLHVDVDMSYVVLGDRPADSMTSMLAHEVFETAIGPGVDSWQNAGVDEAADICAVSDSHSNAHICIPSYACHDTCSISLC